MLKQQNVRKKNKALQLLGCSKEEFVQHLESLWLPGMNWENYGIKENQWSIDHILPCSSFDLTIEENQKICFHYKNMQPLWHIDNLKKSDNIL